MKIYRNQRKVYGVYEGGRCSNGVDSGLTIRKEKLMSIHSDIEMLSVQAMEVYAKRHGMQGDDVVELFHKCQVFEKMLIQYEYLHQVDFEEVMEYIDKLIEED